VLPLPRRTAPRPCPAGLLPLFRLIIGGRSAPSNEFYADRIRLCQCRPCRAHGLNLGRVRT
jgi:hypothetical protein